MAVGHFPMNHPALGTPTRERAASYASAPAMSTIGARLSVANAQAARSLAPKPVSKACKKYIYFLKERI